MAANLKRKLKAPASLSTSSPSRSSPGPGSARYPPGSAAGGGGGNFQDEMQTFQIGIKDESGRVKEYSSEHDQCPICKTDRYSKPSMRLLVSPCYHKACESCIDRLFSTSAQTCPTIGCNRVLRKTNFHHQTFEDLIVEREVGVRRRMGSIFNKTSEDFVDNKSYDDYLELVEDLTFNLLNDIDIPGTEARIQSYQRENAATIQAKATRALTDRQSALAQEESDRLEREANASAAKEEDDKRERKMEELKTAALDDIARGGDGKGFYAEMDKIRADAENGAGAAEAFRMRKKARKVGQTDGEGKKHLATSPSYAGPYIPLPFSFHHAKDDQIWNTIQASVKLAEEQSLEDEPESDIIELDAEEVIKYKDPALKELQLKTHGTAQRIRAGGFDIREVWMRDVRLGMEGLLMPSPGR